MARADARIRVCVVDDRAGLRALIEAQPDMEVAGDDGTCDVVVLDVSRHPAVPVLVRAGADDHGDLLASIRALRRPPLSDREREVLKLIAEGHTNREAADALVISVKSVETYRGRVMEKLGLASRAELVRFAVECGFLGARK